MSAAIAEPPRQVGCILIVEDNENDAFLLQRAFKQSGLKNELVFIKDGLHACHWLEARKDCLNSEGEPIPSLIVLDLYLPIMEGFELLAWRKTFPELLGVPVVVLTQSADPGDEALARKLGAQDYRQKPSDTHALSTLLLEWHERFMAND